ncbi:hypothetical protein [Ferruginibacter sp. SUN106]|uniref:hypothetical protein n=1 Tax=Ferruginibacter sp. SUN106 TaxID=2978348 RepID=UPI003D3630C8
MKKYILTLIIFFSGFAATAQDINLTDSVIYFGNKPVAYYVKELNQSNPHYNIYIIGLNMKMLIAAQVVKFDAPVRELKPFYYYDVIFANEKDTFAIYHEGQAFAVELASLLKQYNLLDGNKINKYSLAKFKRDHIGNASLKAKIKEYEDYLDVNRYFNEQTVRDRTKPVTIVNDKIIMQDGKKIGLVVTNINNTSGGVSNTYKKVLTKDNTVAVEIDTKDRGTSNSASNEYTQIMLPTNRIVDASQVIIESKDRKRKHSNPPTLYEISVPLNQSSRNEDQLWYVCQLVENYLL